MSACPFCQTRMRSTFLGGLPREECGGCGSVWFEGEALAKVMGGSVSDALMRRAKGRQRFSGSIPALGMLAAA